MGSVINTGLGWYADEDWLLDYQTHLGSISNQQTGTYFTLESTPGTGLPNLVLTIQNPNSTNYCRAGVVSGSIVKMYIVLTSSGSGTPLYVSDSSFVVRHYIGNNPQGGVALNYQSDYDSNSQFFYHFYDRTFVESGATFSPYIDPIETTKWALPDAVSEALSIIRTGSVTIATYNKETAGYSVTCLCAWRADYIGPVYISPVLISTDQNYTIYSRNNSIPTVVPSEHIIDGVTFYMRKIPLDTYTVDTTIDSEVPVVDLSGVAQTNDSIFEAIAFKSKLGVGEYDGDPYAPGGESEPGKGDGTFDFSSTEIPYSGLPTIGAFATGMIDVYVPSRTELVSLSQYLWAGAFDVDNFKKIVADPMDVIIGLQIVPLTAAQIGTSSSVLVVGNISTGLSMAKATKQYVDINMGTVEILPKWGAYLDFSPYSKLTLFLPYIGYVDINPDDCMNGTISVKYYVDIISGNCVAQVKCNDHVLYQFSGNCSCQLPITAGQYQNIALAGINILGSALGAASSMIMPKGGGNTGDKLGAVSGVTNLFGTIANEAISMVKPAVQRSGGFGSSSGLMGLQTPYLILTVPRMCIPGEQNKYIGYPSFVTKAMNTLSGFNSVEVTHLNNMSCTAEEADEIIALLSQGVIF